MKKILFFLLFYPISILYAQYDLTLKPEFKNLKYIKQQYVSEIISSYSFLYGDSIKKDYVLEKDYNLYYDSLSLWYMTHTNKFFKEKDLSKEATYIGKFNITQKVKTKYKLPVYVENFYYYYNKYKNTNKVFCIPANFETAQKTYKFEPKRFQFYNKNRIINYKYKIINNDNSVDLKGSLYFHKTIQPIDNMGAKYFNSHNWIPVAYIYAKPKHKVYLSKNYFKDLTGLPDNIIDTTGINVKNLHISNKFYPKYFENLYEENLNINVGDTLVLFDKNQIDGDIVKLIYLNKTEIITLSNKKQIIVSDKINNIIIVALSEGQVGLCTITLEVNDELYKFNMKQYDVVKINFNNSYANKL